MKEYVWQIRAGLEDENAVPPVREGRYKPAKGPLGAWHPFSLPSGGVRPTLANTIYRRCLKRVDADGAGIRWGHTETHKPLGTAIVDVLSTAYEDGRGVRVAGLRPAGIEGAWQCFEAGRFEAPDDDNGDGFEVRIGYGPPGCIERLPEFEGW